MTEISITLGGIIQAAQFVYRNIQRMQANKNQSDLLVERIHAVLDAIKPIEKQAEGEQEKFLPGLMALQKCLNNVNSFIVEFSSKSKLNQFFLSSQYTEKIKETNIEIHQCISVLNLSIDASIFLQAHDTLALQSDLEEIKLQQAQILAQQQTQTSLLIRMEHKISDPSTSHDIRELKQGKAIQEDFLKRIESAVLTVVQQQKMQAEQTDQDRQNQILQLIHKQLIEAQSKPGVNQADIITIKHEHMLVLSMLQEIQQDFQKLKNREDFKSTMPRYTNETHDAESLLKRGLDAKKKNDFTLYYSCCLQAAKLGHTIAKAHVGNCLLQGKGTEKDTIAAFAWITQAAQEHEPRAMYNLARMYETGTGTEPNISLAITWYENASKQTSAIDVAAEAEVKCKELTAQFNKQNLMKKI